MDGVSLRDLVKENILLAESFTNEEYENKKFEELLNKAEEGKDIEDEAFTYLADILRKYKRLNELLFKAALAKDDSNQFESALFMYKLSNIIEPDAKAFNNIAVIYAGNNNPKEALKAICEGLERFPEDQTLKDNYNLLH